MADLPAEILTGRITGTIHQIIPDTYDAGSRPDVTTVPRLAVSFTPSVDRLVIPGRVFFLRRFEVEWDQDLGTIMHAGNPWIDLVATDSPTVNPTSWFWTCTVEAPQFGRWSFPIDVPAGSTRDLSEIAPIKTGPAVWITRGPKGDKGDKGDIGDRGPQGFAGGSDGATAEWITRGPATRAALAATSNMDQVDCFALARDLAPRYTKAEFVRLGSTLYQVEFHDGSRGAIYSWIKDPSDDFYKLSQCSTGFGQTAGPYVTITDADHIGTWTSISTVNRYTTVVGAGFTLTVPKGATDLSLRVLRNDAGGMWSVAIDGAPPVQVSCWSALAAPNVELALVTLASGLDQTQPHKIVATFTGPDPAHTPSGPARGWVRKDDAAGTLVGYNTGAKPTTPVLASVSNKEFAWLISAGGRTDYVPEHSGIASAFAATPMKIIIDGMPVDFAALANTSRVPIKSSFEVRQHLTGRVGGVDVLDLTATHTLDTQGRLSFSGQWRALAAATISGYPMMLPNGDSATGEFVTGIGSWQATKSDESTVSFPRDTDAVASGAVLSRSNHNVIGAATMRNPRLTYRRGEPHTLTPDQRLFVWHRAAPSAPKMYWSAADKWPIAPGDSYAWGFDLIVADITGIYDVLSPA